MQKINNYVIQVKNAYVIYNYKQPSQFIGLKDFSFNFEKNKIYCIIGKSGSGKSTLISLFNGLNRLNYGDICLDGINLNSAKDLNKTILMAYKIVDMDFIKSVVTKNKEINNSFYLIKVAKDAKDYDVSCYLSSINDNQQFYYHKLNKIEQAKLNIATNMVNDFYLVEIINESNAMKYLNIVHDMNEFKIPSQNTIKDKNTKRTKRIKQYKDLKKKIGMVSQFPEFQLFKYTVIDDVSFGLRALGTKKAQAYEIAKKQLLKLGIKESHFNHSPFALSGGQKRRVAIAGVLAIEGQTLIFDEPTAGLDPTGEKEMLEIILNAKHENKNVFVVTHSMNQVLEIADEILVIHEGRLIAHGTSYEIFNNQDVLKHTNIEQPYVINMVNKLINKDKKYMKLNQYQPRTIEELADCLVKIKREGK